MGTKIEAGFHSMDNCNLVNRCYAYHYYYGLAIDTTYYMWKVNRWAELVIVGKVCNHLRVNPLRNRVRKKQGRYMVADIASFQTVLAPLSPIPSL